MQLGICNNSTSSLLNNYDSTVAIMPVEYKEVFMEQIQDLLKHPQVRSRSEFKHVLVTSYIPRNRGKESITILGRLKTLQLLSDRLVIIGQRPKGVIKPVKHEITNDRQILLREQQLRESSLQPFYLAVKFEYVGNNLYKSADGFNSKLFRMFALRCPNSGIVRIKSFKFWYN